ncbi:MAG: hypothetical protein ACHQQR_08470 [Gemmatimonadales bacterium]
MAACTGIAQGLPAVDPETAGFSPAGLHGLKPISAVGIALGVPYLCCWGLETQEKRRFGFTPSPART